MTFEYIMYYVYNISSLHNIIIFLLHKFIRIYIFGGFNTNHRLTIYQMQQNASLNEIN